MQHIRFGRYSGKAKRPGKQDSIAIRGTPSQFPHPLLLSILSISLYINSIKLFNVKLFSSQTRLAIEVETKCYIECLGVVGFKSSRLYSCLLYNTQTGILSGFPAPVCWMRRMAMLAG